MASLVPRMIQDFASAKVTEKHWGYAERVVPCTNDAGSCEYLDVVYGSHDLGMIYTAVLWAVLLSIFGSWAVIRLLARPSKNLSDPAEKVGGLSRALRAIATTSRHYLLPELRGLGRAIFGRTTRLQVLILAILSGYLLVFSFIGMRFARWDTPVKSSPGLYNIRTTLGPFANRVGILAYALTPFSVLLATRESLLSLATGLPYQSFNFLHRWLGYIILAQGALHTIGWTVVEVRLYQPQPSVAIHLFMETYMIWGCVAMFLILLLFVFSLPPVIRYTGHEFFRKTHYLLAMLYVGACWGHWAKLYVWLLASLILWFLDRTVRLLRTAWLHLLPSPTASPTRSFSALNATITTHEDPDGDVLRLTLAHPTAAWSVGQHHHLTFPSLTPWQSHPFTPLSLPVRTADGYEMAFLLRAKGGETRRLALAARFHDSIPVVLGGPYGTGVTEGLGGANVLCVAGGTGVTFVLPVLLGLVREGRVEGRKVGLVWAVRRAEDVGWVERELGQLREEGGGGVGVRVFVTRQGGGAVRGAKLGKAVNEKTVDEGSESEDDEGAVGRPDLRKEVEGFVEQTVSGRTVVFASGPGEMVSELRDIVAGLNHAGRVWRGETRGVVELVSDDRLEW